MKYEFKGTPAPWVVASTPKSKLKVVCNSGFLIAMMYNGNPSDKDAHLIAAAPDLLQACITLHQILDPLTNNPASDDVMQRLTQAIHKALNITT